MSPPKRKPRRRVSSSSKESKEEDHLAWLGYLNTSSMKNLALVAAAVAAVIYLNGTVFSPLYESGPPPFPARAEVEALRKEAAGGLADVNMGLSETLEVAKAARQEAQQAVQEARDGRTTRLLQLKLELEARLKANPNDTIISDLYARTLSDLARLTAMPPAPSNNPSVVKEN